MVHVTKVVKYLFPTQNSLNFNTTLILKTFKFYLVCEDGFYNKTCSAVCGKCVNNEPCDKETGECRNGCQLHFKRPLCQGI